MENKNTTTITFKSKGKSTEKVENFLLVLSVITLVALLIETFLLLQFSDKYSIWYLLIVVPLLIANIFLVKDISSETSLVVDFLLEKDIMVEHHVEADITIDTESVKNIFTELASLSYIYAKIPLYDRHKTQKYGLVYLYENKMRFEIYYFGTFYKKNIEKELMENAEKALNYLKLKRKEMGYDEAENAVWKVEV